MKNFSCPLCCNMGFSNREDLKKHLEKVTTSLSCPCCHISCKNVANLIKHLDVCTASNNNAVKNLPPVNSPKNNLDTNNQLNENYEDDDDVEGYFCTVCNIKIPDVYKHIQQFHNGQEVILQDDDEDSESSKSSTPNNFHPDPPTSKRKVEEVVNGATLNSKKPKNEPDSGEAGQNETFYCPQCNVSFQSLTEHTTKYHKKDKILLQEISISDLFPDTKLINGSWYYSCGRCHKTMSRKATLAKHLKLSSTFVAGKSKNVDPDAACKTYAASDADKSMTGHRDIDAIKLEPETEFEIEEVRLDNYDFDELGHSIFSASSTQSTNLS